MFVHSIVVSWEMASESSPLFKKGNWNVDTKDEMKNVIVVAVPVGYWILTPDS